MKRILFLETGTPSVNGEAGGSLYSLLELIKGIKNQNYEITILFYHNFNIIKKFEELGCRTIVKEETKTFKQPEKLIKLKKAKSPENKLLSWLKFQFNWIKLYPQIIYIYRVLLQNKINLLHCNDRISTNFSGIIAAKLSNVKVIVHQRQYETNLPFIIKVFGKTVNKYYAISNSIADNLIEKLSVKKNKIEVVHNWTSSLNNITISNRERNNVLWLGRIVPWKGTHLIIDIVEGFISNKIKFNKIVVYGEADPSEAEYFNNIKENILKKELNKYFEFRGYKSFSEIDHSEFKAFIHTSIKPEPFGRTIIEAMSFGIPVFATNLGGAKDIIKDGISGFLYSPDNLTGLYRKFILLENKKIKKNLITKAFQSVEDKFSGNKQIKLLIKNYKLLLDE